MVFKSGGFAPLIVILILAAAGVVGTSTVVAANNSTPESPLFGLDQALERVQVSLASSAQARAKVKLEIAKERVDELNTLTQNNKPVNEALEESQKAIDDVEIDIRTNNIKLESNDLNLLLTQLQSLLETHQGLIRRVEIKVKDGETRAKIKFFE